MTTEVLPTSPLFQTGLGRVFKQLSFGFVMASALVNVGGNNFVATQNTDISHGYVITSDCSCIKNSCYDYNGITFNFSGDSYVDSKALKNIEKLNNFKLLPYDWNEYGAQPIPNHLIDCIIDLVVTLPVQPEVFPLTDGKVQIEFDGENNEYLEIEFGENCLASVYQIDEDGQEFEYEVEFDSKRINNIVTKFYE